MPVTTGLMPFVFDPCPSVCIRGFQLPWGFEADKPKARKRPYKIEDFYEPFPRQKEFHDSRRKISAVWRGGGAGKNQGAAVRSDPPGAQASGRGHAAAAADVSGAGSFADHLFSARCAARAVREVQRSQAHRHVAERLDDAVCLLRHRKRCVPLSGRGISFHRRR